MKMTLHHSTIQRLAFVKYLYSLAVEQSKSPPPMSAASLLTFHDSIEFFLQLSAEHLNIGDKKLEFIAYWDLFKDKLGIPDFPQKESMRRLNKARVAIKHHGTMPSNIDIESFRAVSNLFFDEAMKIVFGIEFSQVTLIDYVSPEESRNHLKKAEELCAADLFDEATTEIALAFEKMISHYEESKNNFYTGSPFFFGRDMTFFSSFNMGIDKKEVGKIAEFIDGVKESIDAMQSAIKILALGLDYRKYSKFRLLLPHISRTLTGSYIIQHGSFGQRQLPTQEYIEFCINYVVECAIKLNEFDYEISKN